MPYAALATAGPALITAGIGAAPQLTTEIFVTDDTATRLLATHVGPAPILVDAPQAAPSASLEAWLDEAWRRIAREKIARLSASHGLAEAHWHRHEAQRAAAGAEPTPVEFFDVAVAVARELRHLGVEP